jgi:hypothetical protein
MRHHGLEADDECFVDLPDTARWVSFLTEGTEGPKDSRESRAFHAEPSCSIAKSASRTARDAAGQRVAAHRYDEAPPRCRATLGDNLPGFGELADLRWRDVQRDGCLFG